MCCCQITAEKQAECTIYTVDFTDRVIESKHLNCVFFKTLFIGTKTQSENFRDNPLCQATKRHLTVKRRKSNWALATALFLARFGLTSPGFGNELLKWLNILATATHAKQIKTRGNETENKNNNKRISNTPHPSMTIHV